MESFFSTNGKFTFLNRTHHREEGGGYENWMFEVNNEKYYYTADIRIPGLVNANLQPIPEKREKVIVVDFFHESGLNSVTPYKPINNSGYSARAVIACLAELTIGVIEPIRKYRYVAMPGDPEWLGVHNLMIKRLGVFAEPDIVKGVYDVLEPNLQKMIDMGYSHCVVGDLITNPVWRKNNNLLPLE